MFAFAHVWPWISLGAAGLLFLLLATNALRGDRGVSRWRDIVWLTWAAALACLLHQFEEHGVDVDGKAYAFRAFMCAEIGLPDPRACPVPLSFITALNIATVWVAGPLSALLAKRWPVIGLSFFAIPIASVFAHLVPAIVLQNYNPGLVTAIGLFLPLSLIAFSAAVTRYHLGVRAILATLFAGAMLHAFVRGSLLAFVNGQLGLDLLLLLLIVSPLVSALTVAVLAGRRSFRLFAT
jgi:hypothetical protein